MALVTFYFELHQPFRLHPEKGKFLWEEKDREVFHKVTEKCYLPATRMFAELIANHPRFKITMSMSGTFLEQAELYELEVIKALQDLLGAGKNNNQVEFLEETYYHSLTSLFKDPSKKEFKDQVSLHRQKMKELFGVKPTSFRNTELMYNNSVAATVADMGYKAILCEQRNDLFMNRGGSPVSSNAVFRSKGTSKKPGITVLARNRDLSDDVAFRFKHIHLTAEQYAEHLAKVDGESVVLGYDYEHLGEHIWEDTGIFNFWQGLPRAMEQYESIVPANPTEIAEKFQDTVCPIVDIHPLSTSSWADMERNTQGWLGTETQQILFKDIERMQTQARKAGGERLKKWRYLTTSDHLYYLHEGLGPDRGVHDYFSPYGSIATATHLLTRQIDKLDVSINSFNIRKRHTKTPVIMSL